MITPHDHVFLLIIIRTANFGQISLITMLPGSLLYLTLHYFRYLPLVVAIFITISVTTSIAISPFKNIQAKRREA